MRMLTWIIGILGLMLAGCQSGLGGGASTGNAANQGNSGSAATPTAGAIAYLDGQPISDNDLKAALYEAAGGQVLAELVLDRRIQRKLAEKGLTIGQPQVTEEKTLLLRSLDANNEDNAVRLLRELRQRRGLGNERFDRMLWRNAAMRALIRDEVVMNDAIIQQAFDIEYGAKYEVRLIVVDRLNQAADLLRQAKAEGGAAVSFIDLAAHHSTDSSRTQGGLLAPISPADPTWPDGIRKAVIGLNEGQISDPIALERGFALIKLERKIPAQNVKLADVQADISNRMRRNLERIRMQALARGLLSNVDLLVNDRTLRQSWDQQKEAMFAE